MCVCVRERESNLPINNKSTNLFSQNITLPVPSNIENPIVNGVTTRLNANKKLSNISHIFLNRRSGLKITNFDEASTVKSVVILSAFSLESSCLTKLLKLISGLPTVVLDMVTD